MTPSAASPCAGNVASTSTMASYLIESITPRDQSSSPIACNRCRIARCSAGHSPALVYSAKRRCAVGRVTPNNALGSFYQKQPA